VEQPEVKTKKSVNWRRGLVSSLVAVAIFTFGWGVGNGNISLGFGDSPSPQSSELPAQLNYEGVDEVYSALKASFDGELTQTELEDGLKRGLAQAAGDPYTEYLTAEESREFDEGLSGSFTGIGAELSKQDDAITVIAPLAGFPAEAAGLRAKDIIIEIDGKPAYDLTITEAVKRIRGPKGTVVKLKVLRDNKDIDLEITRDNINIPSVESEIKDGNIGYIKITRFGDDTVELVQQAATEFAAVKVKGVVVDVRNNPGGLLNGAVDISSVWLNDKTVLTERRGDVTIKTYTSGSNAILEGVPTVVLINEGSASASEILAGALRDNKAATLLGETSFGKGSVQKLETLSFGGTLKVTIARWFTPEGKNIDESGIAPDKEVKFTEEDFEKKRDPQLDAAIQSLN
jgi:carboxyl-terminal processing protease